MVFQEFFLKVHSSSLQLLRLYRQMSAPQIVGERLHLLLCSAEGSLCGHRRKVSSLRAGLVLFLLVSLPRSFSPRSNNCAALVSACGSRTCGRRRMPGCLRWGFFPRKSELLSTWDTPGTRAANACRPREKQKGRRCLLREASPRSSSSERFCQRKDALTRDWGPRRLRHDLQHVKRSVTSLAVAMAPGHTGNGSAHACDPSPPSR